MRGDRSCGLCEAVVTPDDVYEERVVLFRSALFCPKCAPRVGRLRRETLLFAASFDKRESYQCSRCPAPLTAFELDNARFTRWQGELFCTGCSSNLKALLEPAKAPAAADEAVDICSSCSGLISAKDVEGGRSLVVDGETYCASCRTDSKAAPAKKKGGLDIAPLPDSDVHEALPTATEIAPELELDLMPSSGQHAALPAPTAAKTTTRNAKKLLVEEDLSEPSAPDGLLSAEIAPAGREESSVAELVDLDEPDFAPIAKKSARPDSRKATARAKKLDAPKAAPAAEAPKAAPAKAPSTIAVEEFSLDSTPNAPALASKETVVDQDAPAKAAAAAAKVRASGSKASQSGRRKRTGAVAAPEESVAKLAADALATKSDAKRPSKRVTKRSGSGERGAKCPICARAAGDSKHAFADKPYCQSCSVELAEVLAKTKMKNDAEQACASCGQPAAGDGALLFTLSNIAYCEGCAPEAEPIVESMVRDGMERRRRRARKPLVAFAAVALVALVGGGFGFLHAEPAREGPQSGGIAKAAATEKPESDAGEEADGPAKALLDAFEQDVAHQIGASGLASSPLSFEAVGARDHAADRLRVVTMVAHPSGGSGKVRALIEFSVSDHKLERRLVRWLDEGGGSFEKNAPLALADGVLSFRIEWTRGATFVDPTQDTASGVEFAKKAAPRAVRAVLVTQDAAGRKTRLEREIVFARP